MSPTRTVSDEYRDLDSLTPHPRNYQRHSEHQVELLADAMRTVAFTAPFIVLPPGVILAGHARRLALLKLRADAYPEPAGVQPGWRVPCRVVDCSDVDAMRILATDNIDVALIDTDTQALASLLTDLQKSDALTGTWYNDARVDELIAGLTKDAPGDFIEYDENIETEHTCPKCGYAWSGGR